MCIRDSYAEGLLEPARAPNPPGHHLEQPSEQLGAVGARGVKVSPAHAPALSQRLTRCRDARYGASQVPPKPGAWMRECQRAAENGTDTRCTAEDVR